ncbi:MULTISPECIES: twin-arginine translocase TatA/TatE family subunit [unclassified Wenzhouxiangella]|uniref:twin-arginine translocase TatA/TatE family subunit n=1 Tax=unclassified Wenzhouxiangella TaxID=2613841 RepID=UPI000E325621|nr:MULTISPECIES: twin-arginine translocase TatA/TatE family subunit [unclassified Wenzhouxiangella]RFF27180.1 twin-arginine translocase TatA/TatE family subunit [Wenzhouxiangella sp. 15181]RFP69133.1 twin-arginine translocase TatA/TatE family subunit [Wenzhouxiangella sp. 15190]
MGIGNISWPQILVILVIVLLIFGTKRIRNIGSDLGGAIREFRKGVGENEDEDENEKSADDHSQEKSSSQSEEQDDSTSKREH